MGDELRQPPGGSGNRGRGSRLDLRARRRARGPAGARSGRRCGRGSPPAARPPTARKRGVALEHDAPPAARSWRSGTGRWRAACRPSRGGVPAGSRSKNGSASTRRKDGFGRARWKLTVPARSSADDAAREVAVPGLATQADSPTSPRRPRGSLGASGFMLPEALDRGADVARAHGPAVRVAQAGPQHERLDRAAARDTGSEPARSGTTTSPAVPPTRR